MFKVQWRDRRVLATSSPVWIARIIQKRYIFFSFSLIVFSRFSVIIMYYLDNKSKQVYALKCP